MKPNRLLAGALSFILTLTGIIVIAAGVIVVITAVQMAVQEADVPNWIVGCLFVILGAGIVFGGVRLITRVRPRIVRRLCGCEVPRIPRPLAALAGGDGGAWSAGEGGGD